MGLGGGGGSVFFIVMAASGAGAAVADDEESGVVEVADWSADFWQPAMAKAKQRTRTLAGQRRRFINDLRVGWAENRCVNSKILRSVAKSICE
jgi:hypothetical protein